MKKVFFISAVLCCILNNNSIASPIDPETDGMIEIALSCQTVNPASANQGIHRTPPQIPNIYFDASVSTVYFENPYYECTLELVVHGTNTVVYSYNIPNGDDTVQLPTYLSGVYELHIHRGNYCFWGIIELQ